MKRMFKKYGSYMLLIVLFIGVIVIVNNTKRSYAITAGVDDTGINDSGKITTAFTTNYNSNSGSNNYMQDADIDEKYKSNYMVPKSLKTNGNKILYLFSKNLYIPSSNHTFGFDNENESGNPTTITDRGIIYIISHGYNDTNKVNTVFTDSENKAEYGELTDEAKQQYVTQMAIWLYIYDSENKPNFNSYCVIDDKADLCDFRSVVNSNDNNYTYGEYSYDKVRADIINQAKNNDYKWLNYIIKLVDDAKTYKNKTAETPKLSSLSDVVFTLSSDKKKVTSSLITPTSSKNNENFMYYSVAIKDDNNYGVYLVDQNNNKITNTTNMSGSFKVVIPIDDDVTKMDLTSVVINIYGIYTYDNGYSYRITSAAAGERVKDLPKYSNVSLGYVPTKTIGVKFRGRNFTDISKIDATNGKELAGATLQIINKTNDDVVEEWVSGNKPHSTFLDDGEYKLCETVAPDGYKASTECIDFTIKNEQTIQVITMKNSPITVPNTGLTGSSKLFIFGSIILLIGGSILIIFKRTKKDVIK